MGFVTDMFSKGGKADFNNAIDVFKRLDLPDYQYDQLMPEQIEALMQQESGLSGYESDPRLKDAQLNSLDALQAIIDGDGMTAMDKSRMNQINMENNTIDRGNRDAIMQNAQARGVGGSGLEMAQKMISQQQGAGRRSQQGFDVAAQAEQRALEALMQSGQLSGQVRGQDLDEASQVAKAQDMINQFNTANQNQARFANTQANNQAQQSNRDHKVGLQQQSYQDRLNRAQGMAGGYTNKGTNAENRRNSGNQVMGGLIGAGIGAVSGGGK